LLRQFLLYTAGISILAAASNRLLVYADLDATHNSWSIGAIDTLAQHRLRSIATALDSTRDRLAAEDKIRLDIGFHTTNDLFPILRAKDSAFGSRIPDSILYFSIPEARRTANRGVAVYSGEGRLLSWYSSVPATFSFDTVLNGEQLLANRDRGILLEDQPIYAYLLSIRKLISREGRLEGYVAAKWQLATKQPLTGNSTANFLSDSRARFHRELDLTFGGRPKADHAGSSWAYTDLYADPSDPQSFVGTLAVSDTPQSESSFLYRATRGLWIFGMSLALFGFLLWLLVAVAEAPQQLRPVASRSIYSVIVLLGLIVTRILISELGGIGMLFGSSYQEAGDFASDWGFGIVRNPLELFITTVFATAAVVMLWIIWMPRQRLVRDDSQKRDIETIVRREAWGLIIFTVGALLLSQLLIDVLSVMTESIVNNGSLRYLAVKRVLPAPGMLMMLLSFLGIGVSFLFSASLLLTFALRAVIFFVSRRLSLRSRIAYGCIIMAALWVGMMFLIDAADLTDTSLLYRTAVTTLVFLVSASIIVIDALAPGPLESGPSFLYKLPRSSRSILFILAVSALVMSPLVSAKQLLTDKDVAVRIVQENAQVDAPQLETTLAQLLATAQHRLVTWAETNHDTLALRQEAFLTWFEGMRDHPSWDAIVEIRDAAGASQSHFATRGALTELRRLRPNLDSQFAQLQSADSTSLKLHVIPGFTTSGTSAVLGGIRYAGPSIQKPIYTTASIWSDLPALVVPRTQLLLFGGSARGEGSNDPLSDGGFIVALYRPDARRVTNTPALDVPSTIPPSVLYRLARVTSFWGRTVISGSFYQTLYYRATSGPRPTVITVSVPEPTFGRTLEFALRLNAIGLIYGVLIVIILLIVRQVVSRRIRFALRFRDRIFLIVLLIAFVPLVVVTNVTQSLLTERAQLDAQDRLARDATVIKERIARQLETASNQQPAFGHDLQVEVDNLSQIIGRDFSVFDGAGRLRASSRPELYESSLLASILSSSAFEEVILGKRSFYTQPVEIAGQTYEAGYQPVTSIEGTRTLGVIGLATLDEQARFEADIARTTSFIYGTFAALGLILLGIGALFAARVASPIMELIGATERVAKGKLKTVIPVRRDDEIGELMQAFNSMTRELEKSREIVAQTERELAWKEMARQVAHEIKNPLTPMKLSVQHMEHAFEAKDPNFNSIFRRVIRTLREQIDVLTRIATEFSHFGAMPRRRWGPVSIRAVAESAVALFDSERSRIRFIIDVPKDLPRVHSDEEELRRAFVNLLRNATQAIEGWGVIVIRASQDQGMIHITLRDTGYGMSEETLRRAFDPNFSTKTSGMGLGLAIVKKTITDMSGTIRVDSQPGSGTTFFIDLPAREELSDPG